MSIRPLAHGPSQTTPVSGRLASVLALTTATDGLKRERDGHNDIQAAQAHPAPLYNVTIVVERLGGFRSLGSTTELCNVVIKYEGRGIGLAETAATSGREFVIQAIKELTRVYAQTTSHHSFEVASNVFTTESNVTTCDPINLGPLEYDVTDGGRGLAQALIDSLAQTPAYRAFKEFRCTDHHVPPPELDFDAL
tara:strand:- start:313 stop:894 length:582 start_codon:yes stop_codon:yes gene_type:complete